MRTSKPIAEWLAKVEAGEDLEPRGGAGTQNVTDLGGAGLVERSAMGTSTLTPLGAAVLKAWREHGVADDTTENELPRCVILAELGTQYGHPLYIAAYKFWTELEHTFTADVLLNSPEQLYTASYLNQEAAGINAWDLVMAVAKHTGNVAPLDWTHTNDQALSAAAKTALATLHTRVTDFATRAGGRLRFCQAMEIIRVDRESPERLAALIEKWRS